MIITMSNPPIIRTPPIIQDSRVVLYVLKDIQIFHILIKFHDVIKCLSIFHFDLHLYAHDVLMPVNLDHQ